MACDRCGTACRGRLCEECEMIQRVETAHGTDSTPDDRGEDGE